MLKSGVISPFRVKKLQIKIAFQCWGINTNRDHDDKIFKYIVNSLKKNFY